MRVLMLSWEYPPYVIGGLGKHVAELVPALAQQDVEVHLVTPRWTGGDSTEKHDNLHIHRVDPPPPADGQDFHTLAWQANRNMEEESTRLLAQEGPFHLIHAHDWLTAFSASALKHSFRLPLVVTIHATERGRGRGHLSTDTQWAINNVEWSLAYEAWRIIACSKFMTQEIVDYFNAPEDKIDIIPNGVDTSRFDRWDGVDLTSFRSMYALPDEKIVFYVGRIVQEKGLHILIETVPRILRSFPKAKFVIAGTGPLLSDLRRRTWELGLFSKVLFTGFIPDEDRDRLFKVADCAIFPSMYEPFGIVALEAMAAKVPVVVSEVGGLKEVVQHAETGITVYPDNTESLAWGILHTLEHPDWAQARVKSAYREVVNLYNWDRIAKLTRKVYERVVEERARASW
ncbi:MAG: glycosyltransferase family 4 protein [Chloroflexota bacterium]|nr:glycosyltransferase family 4 protein [Anaerolineae bacterium]